MANNSTSLWPRWTAREAKVNALISIKNRFLCRTHIGEPIRLTDEEFVTLTPQQVRDRVAASLEALINKHQRLPGSVFQAQLDRFRKRDAVHRQYAFIRAVCTFNTLPEDRHKSL